MQITRTKTRLILFLATVFIFTLPLAIRAQADAIPWGTWASLDIRTIGDDSTGSTVAVSTDVTTPDGNPALRVTPGGTSDETKIILPLTGADLADWAYYTRLELQVYLPEGNTLNANNFFLGMADVTGGAFNWVAGVFSDTTPQTGWNTISYPLDPAMRALVASDNYNVYFSFYYDDGGKIPLTESFYLGSATLTGLDQAADAASVTAAPSSTNTGSTYRQDVASLQNMDDAAFIHAVARDTFEFFWSEANPGNGLIKDRSTPDSVASIAAVGFGLAAIPIAVDRGWITHDEGYQRVLTTLQTFINGGVPGQHGFFYHFINMRTGDREWNSEVSSIDTALLIAGALVSGQYFAGTDVETLANQLYANVEWDWMLGGGDMVKMGWLPESGFINASWDHFDESMILYVLAIGSPTHPIPATTWSMWHRPVNSRGGYIYLPGEPLFVYQYPLAFLNLRGMEDHYANYWNNTTLACERNHQFAVDNSVRYQTYQNGVWGISASDGPSGYNAYGASPSNQDGTVAPYASASCLPFTPDLSLAGMRALLTQYGARVWRNYGFVSAVNQDRNWYSTASIGIDEGDTLLMLTNDEDGFVWNQFMANPNIQNALNAMGFVPSTGDYAVTPAYMTEVTTNH